MKKIIALFLLTFVMVQANAQNLTGGVKAGINITNFSGGNFGNVDKKALVGFHAGGYINFSLGGISLQPELLVSTAGAKFDNADSSFRLTYLAIPILVKFRASGGFYIEGGPQVGFKLSEDVGNETVEDFAKGLDLALALGIGFQSKGGLGIGARYLAGLSKVGDFEPSAGLDPDFKNSVIQIGISIPLAK